MLIFFLFCTNQHLDKYYFAELIKINLGFQKIEIKDQMTWECMPIDNLVVIFRFNYISKHHFSFFEIKVILHQFWVKKFFPWKFNLEYGGTFTKLFMHVSIRNLQIRVHVYRPRHCCGDWLTFGCFVPMIADHDLVTKI